MPEYIRLLGDNGVAEYTPLDFYWAVGAATALEVTVVLGSGPTSMNDPPNGLPICRVAANVAISKLEIDVLVVTRV